MISVILIFFMLNNKSKNNSNSILELTYAHDSLHHFNDVLQEQHLVRIFRQINKHYKTKTELTFYNF